MKNIVINIGKSRKLFNIVETLAFEAGFNWIGSPMVEKKSYIDIAFDAYSNQGVALHLDYSVTNQKRLMYGHVISGADYDARTEFEKLISYFECKPPLILKIKKHTIEINEDGTIHFGCTTLSSDEVDVIIEKRNNHIRK